MSLVGTRPILQDELLKYELHHRARIAIKPGITGMWQVSGRSDITDFEEVVRLDTEYIANGFELATGDILCWLNSDDMLMPWAFEVMQRFICPCTGNGADYVHRRRLAGSGWRYYIWS